MAETAKLVFDGHIDEAGHFRPAKVKETLARLRRWHGKKVLVTVTRFVKMKTGPQLAFFHGPLLDIWVESSGYEWDEAKWELKQAFLERVERVSKLTGEVTWEVPSLGDLDCEKMSAFLSRCIKEGNLQGMTFPDPNTWHP